LHRACNLGTLLLVDVEMMNSLSKTDFITSKAALLKHN
jgi:hypothetical protein